MPSTHSHAQNTSSDKITDANTMNARIEQVFLRSSSAALSLNNDIACLLDSRENFPAWIEALQQAQHSICIEMYIFATDVFGQQVRDVLLERLQAGVQVFLIYDWLGSIGAHYKGFFKSLIQAGAHIHAYNPLSLGTGITLLSRNHRKSLIIDQHTAFVSGLCISNQWNGNPETNIDAWRDTGLKLQGAIVQDVLNAFLDTWQAMGLQQPPILTTPIANMAIPISDANAHNLFSNANARLIATTGTNANMMRLDLLAVSMAEQTLWITDAYFMPTRMYSQALINAARDGVDVRILVPSTSDIKWIGTVSRTQYRALLEAGARVFEWNGSMVHAKMAIVDDTWARVGSTNLNFSSWFSNRELDVAIEDAATIHYLKQCFIQDLENSTEVVLNEQCQTRLAKERQKNKYNYNNLKDPFNHSRRQKALHQMAQLGSSLDSVIRGSREVDDNEAWAYLSIGLTLLLLCVLLYFVPQILVYPAIFLLLIGGGSITVHAVNGLRHLRRQSKAQEHKQSD